MGEKFASVLVALRSRFYSTDAAAATHLLKNHMLERHQARLRMKIPMLGRQNGRRGDAAATRYPGVNLEKENPTLLALGKKARFLNDIIILP